MGLQSIGGIFFAFPQELEESNLHCRFWRPEYYRHTRHLQHSRQNPHPDPWCLRGIVVVARTWMGVWGREDSNLRVFQVKTARYLTTCMTGSATSPSVPFTPCGGRRNGRSPLVSQGMLHLTSRPDAGLVFWRIMGNWERPCHPPSCHRFPLRGCARGKIGENFTCT